MTITTMGDLANNTYTLAGSGVTLVNAGVQGNPNAAGNDLKYGVYITGSNDTLINNGAIFGYYDAIFSKGGSGNSVINAATMTLTATGYGAGAVKFFFNASGTVTNYGVISGYPNAINGGPGGWAVELDDGGIVTNSGTLLNGGVTVLDAVGTVINSGVILGNAAYGGVYMGAGGQVTNLSSGVISANGAIASSDASGTLRRFHSRRRRNRHQRGDYHRGRAQRHHRLRRRTVGRLPEPGHRRSGRGL